jgi:hypothetical protein
MKYESKTYVLNGLRRLRYLPIGTGAGFGQDDHGIGIEAINMTNETAMQKINKRLRKSGCGFFVLATGYIICRETRIIWQNTGSIRYLR